MNESRKAGLSHSGLHAWLSVGLALVLLCGFTVAGGQWAGARLKALPSPEASPGRAFGHVDSLQRASDGSLRIQGWAISPDGIRNLEAHVNGQPVDIPYGLIRRDVYRAHPGKRGALAAGFDGKLPIGDIARQTDLEVVVVDQKGGKTTLLSQPFFPQAYKTRWGDFQPGRSVDPDDVFFFPMATSHVEEGGADGIRETYAPYESRTVKAGIRVQILYMRTTTGARGDYAFDPDFIPDKKCGRRLIAEDSLHGVMRYAIEKKMPVLFTLNGGIWADAPCDAPQWDINDVLEQDETLCQWNDRNGVMPDSAIEGQAGSFESPELGRALSLNVFAERVRFYKKRNLQQAAALIQRFATEHPDLFIGISLDPDVYINPFFEGRQWYDYNPQTLRQFRDWLRGSGPYANEGGPGVPDLRAYRRPQPLTLADIDRMRGRHHASWEEVDPPRKFPKAPHPFWQEPWTQAWEQFRRHLVKLHYDELSQWVAQTGVPAGRIYSAQGFMPPGLMEPFAVRLDSPAKSYDSGGVSIEGSAPAQGRLGAIIYGDSATNSIPMEGKRSLFGEFRHYSPEWAVVEYNTADLTTPRRMAGYDRAYRSLRETANYGARLVSPMAWNGSPGEAANTKDYVSYTSLRRTPLEDAIQHFMMSRHDLPRGARLWTFGSGRHHDTDGWQADAGTPVAATPDGLRLVLDGEGRASAVSPAELAMRPGAFDALVVQAEGGGEDLRLAVDVQAAGGAWQPLVAEAPLRQRERRSAGFRIPLPVAAAPDAVAFDRLRLVWHGRPGAAVDLALVALYPAPRVAAVEPAVR
ncbi:hypothetical protein [Paracidovorax oryzae]|uniref:hypothetical protein n=1 Tax=Paracidovorax oryzae TaxID=862720 RepID=UPI002583011F